ncbi:cell division protein FtsL [Enterococcus nangangensis]
MAELKKDESYLYDYATPLVAEPVTTPEVQIEIVEFPKKKLRHITFLEKAVATLVIVGTLALAFSTIYLRNEITKVQENITTVQTSINQRTTNIDQLQQEKTELSRADRIKEIAEKLGLTLKEDNIRNVK